MSKDLASSGYLAEPGTILCPICLEKYRPDQIDDLSEEHIIPDALGGKDYTLTCRVKCNNRAGTEIDVHWINKVRVERSLENGEPIKARFKMGSINAGGPVDFFFSKESGFRLNTSKKFGAVPAKRIHEHLSDPTNQFGPLTLRLNFSEEKAFAAIAKSAYLGAFKIWGYRYALFPSLDPVRDAIRQNGSNRLRLGEIVHRVEIKNLQGRSTMPALMLFDREIRGAEVTISVISPPKADGTYIVFLPSRRDFATGSWDGLARAALFLREQKTLDFAANEVVPAN